MQNNKVKNIFITLALIIFLIITSLLVIRFIFPSSATTLISPIISKSANTVATPMPTPAFNPPTVIKYDSSTDLKKELDSIDPETNNSDFKDLLDLTDSLKSS